MLLTSFQDKLSANSHKACHCSKLCSMAIELATICSAGLRDLNLLLWTVYFELAFYAGWQVCPHILQRVVPDDHHGIHNCRDPQGRGAGSSNGWWHGWNGLLRHHTHDTHQSRDFFFPFLAVQVHLYCILVDDELVVRRIQFWVCGRRTSQ